jgi:hypothetical protein
MMNRKQVGWESVDWIYLPENREDGCRCERGSEPLRFIMCRGGFRDHLRKCYFLKEDSATFHFSSLHYITLHYVELVYSVGPLHCVH